MIEKVIAFIVERSNVAAEEIHPDTPLINLGVDSMGLVMIITDFEKEFDVRISDRQFENINTVNDLVSGLWFKVV